MKTTTILDNLSAIFDTIENKNSELQIRFGGIWKHFDPENIKYLTLEELNINNFRIKPSPEYQPYFIIEKEWFLKQVINKNTSESLAITGLNSRENLLFVENNWLNLSRMFQYFIWGENNKNDNKPFGELINE